MRKFVRAAPPAVLILLALSLPALAQDEVRPFIDLSPLFNDFILPIAGSVVTVLAGWALTKLAKKLGIDVEARHREAFQAAVTNAAGLMLQKVGDRLQIGVGSPVLADAVNYVIAAAPDALAKFGITREKIEQTILAKLPQLPAAAAPAAPMSDAAIGAAVARNEARTG